tara:strand:+ start:208 stop:1416 length:1209 start_codon:yes stop_codon:yes gene_type:complete
MKQILNEWDKFLTERVSREERRDCKSPEMCKRNGLRALAAAPKELLQAMAGKTIIATLEQTPRSKSGDITMTIDLKQIGKNGKIKVFADNTGALKAMPGETIVAKMPIQKSNDVPIVPVGVEGAGGGGGAFVQSDFQNPSESLKTVLSKFFSNTNKKVIPMGKTYAIYYGVERSPKELKQIAQNAFKNNLANVEKEGFTIVKKNLPSLLRKGNYGFKISGGRLQIISTPDGRDSIQAISLFVDNPEVQYKGKMSLEDINQFATGKKTRLDMGEGGTVGVYPIVAYILSDKLKIVVKELDFWQKRGFTRRETIPTELDDGKFNANYKDGILYAPTPNGDLLIRWYDPPKVNNGFCKLIVKDGRVAVLGWGAQSKKFEEVNDFKNNFRGWIAFKSKVKAPAFPT